MIKKYNALVLSQTDINKDGRMNMDFSREQLGEIIEKYGDMVYRLAFSMTKNKEDAEDVSQDVFMRYIRHSHKFGSEDEAYLKSWLIRVTINRCKDLFSSFWRKNVISLDKDIALEMEEEREVYESVLKLPLKYRTVIYLYYYEEYSVNEIAGLLKRKSGTVKWQLSRARELLKEYMEGEQ